MLVYLWDSALALTGVLREYDACVVTRRLTEPSSIDLRCHDYPAVAAATYCSTDQHATLYRLERVEVAGDTVTASGRSAEVDLESRVLPAAVTTSGTAGAHVAAILATLTGSRATVVTAGDLAYGTTAQRTADMGAGVLDSIRAAIDGDSMGLTTRLAGGVCYLDIVVPSITGDAIGDQLRNVGTSTYTTAVTTWRNYAYVRGTYTVDGKTVASTNTSITLASTASSVSGTYVGWTVSVSSQKRTITAYNGSTKVATVGTAWKTNPAADAEYTISGTSTVTVDLTSGGERRELWIDSASDSENLTVAQWQAALASEGKAALADTRVVQSVSATTPSPYDPGDVVWYDGSVWRDYLTCTEVTTSYENGTTTTATFGTPNPTLAQQLRSST